LFASEPPQTRYDLHFRVAGIPVRVHPLFWLIPVVLGAQGGDAAELLIWVGVVFVSILVHELGHAFTMQYFGQSARVVLYVMGGLAIPDASPWSSSLPWSSGPSRRSQGTWSQILISAAGPGAGFLLAGIVLGLVVAAGGSVVIETLFEVIPLPWAAAPQTANIYVRKLIASLLSVNIFWGLMNLLPIYPLDGGQISRELFVSHDPRDGVVKSLWLSVVAATVVALAGLALSQTEADHRNGIFLALLFGSLAFSNYQMLQHLGGRRW
jgi:membrane-associated protease RseP (regulator of RpoE activity)